MIGYVVEYVVCEVRNKKRQRRHVGRMVVSAVMGVQRRTGSTAGKINSCLLEHGRILNLAKMQDGSQS